MKTHEKYLKENKVIDVTGKLPSGKLKEVDRVAGNMINALSFIIEEARDGEDVKKVKQMIGRVIKELQNLQRGL